MSDLETEVNLLKEQVKKLQLMLKMTGEHVMQLELEQRKYKLSEMDAKTDELRSMLPANAQKELAQLQKSRAGPSQAADSALVSRESDFVTESDLGDMVGELQGQLNLLDERNIRRVLNSRSPNALTPLPNADGEYHEAFPKNAETLQNMSDALLFENWNHFEMLPNGETLEDLILPDETPEAKEGNAKVMQEIYDSLAKNIGLNPAEFPRKA